MKPINVLFVCGQGNRRGLTAEQVFKHDRRLNARSAGLSDRSKQKLNEADLRWADLILTMERKHAKRIRTDFQDMENLPPIESLNIKDEYIFMQPQLVEELKSGVDAALEEYHEANREE